MKAIKTILTTAAILAGAAMSVAQVTVTVTRWPEEGWMGGGDGNYKFTFKNAGASEAKIVKWTAYWEVGGKPLGDTWGGDMDLGVAPGKEAVKEETGTLPLDVVAKSKPSKPVIAGTFTVKIDGKESLLNWRIEIPQAFLPEKTVLYKGKHVGLELMPSHLKRFPVDKKMVEVLDMVYEAMHDLTGYTPDGGKMLLIQESPAHPYWAYVEGAGKPIIMSTLCVDEVLTQIHENKMPWGWSHEMGHYFDILGHWYFWGPSSVEWQANWKLSYAYETIPDRTYKADFNPDDGLAYSPLHTRTMDAAKWIDAVFLFRGDPYLGDPTRKWDSMTSDEFHSFFLRLVRIYGWEPFKRWYRTYDRFEKAGLKPPTTAEGTIQLIAAILSKETDTDLVPAFQRWRMPVTKADVEAMRKKYPID
jgi:hypothetical protein